MKKGFTLLELLLVVAILAILAAAIGPSFYDRGQISLEYARKSKFINNYNALNLAANVFILASETRHILSTGGTYKYPATALNPADGGLSLLIASNTIQIDTTTYENTKGDVRYFYMAASSDGTYASSTIKLYKDKTGTAITAGNYTTSVDAYLKTSNRTMSDLWEEIKAQ